MILKLDVYDTCCKILLDRIDQLKQLMLDLVEGARSDSKSTAGDKHETARAMMQIEQEKLSNQLNLLLAQQRLLQWIDPEMKSDRVANGSLVKTDKGYIYISIPLGKIDVGEDSIMCISAQSPLGKKLVGMRGGERVQMNGVLYQIESVA